MHTYVRTYMHTYIYTPCLADYRSGYSTSLGRIKIISSAEFLRKNSYYIREWVVFVSLYSLTTLLPFAVPLAFCKLINYYFYYFYYDFFFLYSLLCRVIVQYVLVGICICMNVCMHACMHEYK